MVATGLATEVQRPRSTEVLRRFAAPVHGPAFWIALWATTAVVELVALASIVLAVHRAGPRLISALLSFRSAACSAACGLIAWRAAARQLQRPLDDRHRVRGSWSSPLLAEFETPITQALRRSARGCLGHRGDRAVAELPDRRTAPGNRGARAGRRDGPAGGRGGRPPFLPRARRQLPARAPEPRGRRRVRSCFRPAHGLRVPRHRGRDRRPLQAGLGTAAPRDAAERGGDLGCCSSRRWHCRRDSGARCVAGGRLAAGRAGGVPRRPAALAPRARRPHRSLRRVAHAARRRAAGAAGPGGR